MTGTLSTGALLLVALGGTAVIAVAIAAYALRSRRRAGGQRAAIRPWNEEDLRSTDDLRHPPTTRDSTLDVVLRRIVDVAIRAPQVDAAVVRVERPGADPLLASAGLPPESAEDDLVRRPSHRRGHRAVKLTYLYGRDEPPGAIRAGVIAPLMVDGAQIGSIALYSFEQDGFKRSGVAEIEALATAAGRMLAAMLADDGDAGEPDPTTGHEDPDPLTGLGSRQALMARLSAGTHSLQESGEPLTIVVFDLVGLGAINAAGGQTAGDCALTVVAQTLAREADPANCYRLGGDEFVALLDAEGTAAADLVLRVEVALQLAAAVGFLGLRVMSGTATRHPDEDAVVTLRRATATLQNLQSERAAEKQPSLGAPAAEPVQHIESASPAGRDRRRG